MEKYDAIYWLKQNILNAEKSCNKFADGSRVYGFS
jgi:hypothetical protein